MTEEGLEEQLLAAVVAHERADLQQAAAALVAQLAQYTITLTELEDNLLARLANSQVGGPSGSGVGLGRSRATGRADPHLGQRASSDLHMPRHASFLRGSSHCGDGRARRARRARAAQGDILEDIALIENLEETKRTALEIADKVVLAKETGASLSQAREVRRGAARARARRRHRVRVSCLLHGLGWVWLGYLNLACF